MMNKMSGRVDMFGYAKSPAQQQPGWRRKAAEHRRTPKRKREN